ncbi:hypothetical protein RSOLAG1IB_00647 [Rhizoctonia solani AG-1 IB]|uniref:Uncharacterized protein n=1 Tax=Thanatephorus cucumeris (strain AG1-IB / isolate 7/3/14) TaxID=1108050 RepID=A0A0B7F3M4_THACB|nr:hypothetical protein RSOLAG1IB_00647 [Rhizoctonia solani AG-1 IB]
MGYCFLNTHDFQDSHTGTNCSHLNSPHSYFFFLTLVVCIHSRPPHVPYPYQALYTSPADDSGGYFALTP